MKRCECGQYPDVCARYGHKGDGGCLCARIKVGGEVTEARNWNPDCPVIPRTRGSRPRPIQPSSGN